LRWVVEPSMNYIEFDNDSPFRNSWLLVMPVLILTPIQEYGYSIYKRQKTKLYQQISINWRCRGGI
jgi:hypothetical protein